MIESTGILARHAILCIGLGLVGSACLSPPPAPPPDDRPDIFLLTVDTLRADHLPIYGYERDTAPWLSELAARGMVFDKTESTSSWTVPGVASYLTGMLPHQLGIYDPPNEPRVTAKSFRVPDTARTIAERLKERGYKTYGFTANAHLVDQMGFHQGFDVYRNVGWAQAHAVAAELEPMVPEIAARTQPVFVWIHLFDPHDPYVVRKPWIDEWIASHINPREYGRLSMLDMYARNDLTLGSEGVTALEALYDAEIAYTDDWMRKFTEGMKVDDGDLIVFTSDHGEEFREHGNLGHRITLFEETVEVPLVVAWPDQFGAGRYDERVSVLDVVPTIAEAAGAEIGPYSGVSTRSLLPAARGKELGRGPEVVADLTRRNGPRLRSVYRGDMKLIVVETTPEKIMLFDLASDPGEHKNLASDRPKQVKELRKAMNTRFAGLPMLEPQLMDGEFSDEVKEQLKAMGYLE